MTRPPVRTVPRSTTAGGSGLRPGPKASVRPTPRELRVLKVVATGCSLTEAAERLGVGRGYVPHVLSCLYKRFGIKDVGTSWLGHERRYMAVRICKQNGWWDENEGAGDE